MNVISENCGQLTIARRSPACFLAGNQRILVAGGCSAPNEHTDSMEMLEISEIGEIRSIFLDEKLEIGASCSGFDWDTHSVRFHLKKETQTTTNYKISGLNSNFFINKKKSIKHQNLKCTALIFHWGSLIK